MAKEEKDAERVVLSVITRCYVIISIASQDPPSCGRGGVKHISDLIYEEKEKVRGTQQVIWRIMAIYMVSCRSVYSLIGLQKVKLMNFAKNVSQSTYLIFMLRFMKSNRDVITKMEH